MQPANQKMLTIVRNLLLHLSKTPRTKMKGIRAKSPELIAADLDAAAEDDDGSGSTGGGSGVTAEVQTQTEKMKKQGCCIVM